MHLKEHGVIINLVKILEVYQVYQSIVKPRFNSRKKKVSEFKAARREAEDKINSDTFKY